MHYYFLLGNPRRKVHHTETGGFRVFRPATRDLLVGATDRNGPISTQPAIPRGLEGISKEARMLFGKKSGVEEVLTLRRHTEGRELPQLIQSSPTKLQLKKPKGKLGSKPVVHLPQIVHPHKL